MIEIETPGERRMLSRPWDVKFMLKFDADFCFAYYVKFLKSSKITEKSVQGRVDKLQCLPWRQIIY